MSAANYDILAAFLRDLRNSPDALNDYCLAYPALRPDFIALAHERALQDSLSDEMLIDPALERAIAEQPGSESVPDPFAGLDVAAYSALRRSLNVPSLILNAFRDRAVAAGTVPLAFLERIADGLGIGLNDLAAFLGGPPKLARFAQYKADGVPQAAETKMSFATLLDEAGVAPGRAADLLADEETEQCGRGRTYPAGSRRLPSAAVAQGVDGSSPLAIIAAAAAQASGHRGDYRPQTGQRAPSTARTQVQIRRAATSSMRRPATRF